MSLPKISTRGETLDLDLKQGATLRVRHTVTNADATPYDLTGATLRGQVRKEALSTTVAAAFATQVVAPATDGVYDFWLTDEQTAAITCGEKPSNPESQYVYDIEIEDAAGDVRCVLEGKISVIAGVTR